MEEDRNKQGEEERFRRGNRNAAGSETGVLQAREQDRCRRRNRGDAGVEQECRATLSRSEFRIFRNIRNIRNTTNNRADNRADNRAR